MENDFKIRNGTLDRYFGSDKNLIIPDGVEIIGAGCFSGCDFIESVTIPESVFSIECQAFNECSNLKKINFAPNGRLTEIAEYAFKNCEQIEELLLPPSLRQIKDAAFYWASNLKKLILNDGLKWIGGSAFEGCKNLFEVFIPASVTTIEPFAIPNHAQMVVHAEAPSEPFGWHENWLDPWVDEDDFGEVVWGCKR